jgi:DNA-damage-inducible protein J
MASTSMLHVRMDDATKAQGDTVLKAIGLSASDAVRILYLRLIADQAFPLEMKVPNLATRAAMVEANEIVTKQRARFATADVLIADLETPGSR